MLSKVPGTQGYAAQAHELIRRYESETFEHKHRAELHVVPDAAWLAEQGHSVLAVEPTEPFRLAAQARHPHQLLNGLMTAFLVFQKFASGSRASSSS
jgi:hypothetical protein